MLGKSMTPTELLELFKEACYKMEESLFLTLHYYREAEKLGASETLLAALREEAKQTHARVHARMEAIVAADAKSKRTTSALQTPAASRTPAQKKSINGLPPGTTGLDIMRALLGCRDRGSEYHALTVRYGMLGLARSGASARWSQLVKYDEAFYTMENGPNGEKRRRVELTEKGRPRAEELAFKFAQLRPDVFRLSPKKKAMVAGANDDVDTEEDEEMVLHVRA